MDALIILKPKYKVRDCFVHFQGSKLFSSAWLSSNKKKKKVSFKIKKKEREIEAPVVGLPVNRILPFKNTFVYATLNKC